MADFQVTLTAAEINAQRARHDRHVGAQVAFADAVAAVPVAGVPDGFVHPDAETIALWRAEIRADVFGEF